MPKNLPNHWVDALLVKKYDYKHYLEMLSKGMPKQMVQNTS